MSNLIAHGDSKRVGESEVRAVIEPEFTPTWHPVSHARILDSMELAVHNTGMDIETRQYSLARDGAMMFGVWHLRGNGQLGANGLSYAIGIRNSLDKSFAVGICAGTHIFVCDNLAFAGDFVLFRKHTGKLDDDELKILAAKALEGVVKKIGVLVEWQNSLKEHSLEEDDFKVLTFNAMENRVFAPSKFAKFLDCYGEENGQNKVDGYHNTVYTFHGAVTRLVREDSLFQIQKTNDTLSQAIDDYLELKFPERKSLFQRIKDRIPII
jgi:hypothetical protein